ncbi:hypothetical protein BCR44DRAFT_1430336 [Catenaria anguillulae PL171]|uniref:Nucleotide-diphospho-sugar transferase n=1 Tax=Catenaria anguillulae PL171 TaxID=765915 RepID=A0A1Y2HSI4_9FUNG|nr:hypothetical protein BCR44DRAFT_1430336 [Catenaria anguillulae PL171]
MQVMQQWTDRASYNRSLGQWHFPPLVHTKWNSESTIPPRARECFMHTYWPHLYSIYTAVPRPVMKVDLLRSALLATFGGVWSDIDACPLKPISAWPLKDGDGLVIGVEADMESDVWPNHFARKFQFLTWTFASVPGHPAMTAYLHMARRAVVARRLPNGKYHPEVSDGDVLDLTGPGQFTDAMFTYLRTWGDASFNAMHFMDAPMRFNDAVTGTSRPSYSRNHLDAEAMVLHLFLGSWRQGRYDMSPTDG